MLAHCGFEISGEKESTLQPPEEYVLNIAQIALSPAAMGIGTKGGQKKTIDPTVVQVTSKDIHGQDQTTTICTLDHTCRQVSVALSFGWDEEVVFHLAKGGGAGPVSLTGYLQPSPDGMDNEDDMYGDGDEEDSGSEGEEEEKEESDDEEGGGQGFDDEDDDDEEDNSEEEAPMLATTAAKRKRSFDVSWRRSSWLPWSGEG